MRFSSNISGYLNGDSFSNGLALTISRKESAVLSRIAIIEQFASNKKVVHLGCCDHVSLIKGKIQKNTWLHSRLCNVATKCLGVDNDEEGVEYLKNELGYQDVVSTNLLNHDISVIRNNQWDLMVLGEILEHVDDPTMFLNAIRERYSGSIEKIIISVPNAFCWLNFRYVFSNKEVINTDHRYWFTPYTLAKVVTRAGMSVLSFYFCEHALPRPTWKSKLKIKTQFRQFLLKKFPALRDTLVMVVRV